MAENWKKPFLILLTPTPSSYDQSGGPQNLATNGINEKCSKLPKMARKLDKKVFGNFYLSSPSVGIQNIWLKIGKNKKNKK